MRWIDIKIWQKLTIVFGLFLIGFNSLSVWDYINLRNTDSAFLSKFVFYHISVGLIILLISIWLIYILNKSFKSTLETTAKMASGDFTFEIKTNRKDELGQMLNNISALKNRLSAVIEHIKETTANLIAASSELNSGSQLISNGANDQASASTEISMTMDQVAMISKQSTENANETNAIAKFAYEGIIKGAEDLNLALSVIEEIAEKNSIISEISYQTKILSINASIEAARSSEFGKGFSVIAEHIKRLAETTQVSASEIEEVSKKGVRITRESATMLRELVNEFHKTAELTQKVADSGAEQYSAIDQINLSMQELNNITQQNASSSEELTASSEELVRLSESLSDQIDFFKLTKEDLLKNSNANFMSEIQNNFVPYSEDDDETNSNYYAENTINHTFNQRHKNESDYSRDIEDRIKRRMEQFENNDIDKDYTREFQIEPELVSESSTSYDEIEKASSRTKSKNETKYTEKSTLDPNIEKSTKVQHGGVKINLSDNDEIDNQFERIK